MVNNTNPLLKYINQRVVIHTTSLESLNIVTNWIIELGGRNLTHSIIETNYKNGYCMEDISIGDNCHCPINYAIKTDRKVIHFDDLDKETIFETW